MADIEDASVNETGEPTEAAPQTLTPLDPAPAPDDDLRALAESLEQPTGAMPAIGADAAETEAAVEVAVEPDAEAEPAPEATLDTEPAPEAATDSLDDIAPGTMAVSPSEDVSEAVLGEVAPVRKKVSWWPFVGYVVVWLGAAGYAVWRLQQLPIGQVAYETDFYTMSMLGGVVLLASGPVLLLIVWLASWIGRKGARIGSMFISALLKGAFVTLLGAMIWIGALLLIDYLRLGRPF